MDDGFVTRWVEGDVAFVHGEAELVGVGESLERIPEGDVGRGGCGEGG